MPRRPPPSVHVKFRDLGRRPRSHGVAIELWTSHGTIYRLLVSLRHYGGRLVDGIRLAKLSAHKLRLILRDNGAMPSPDRYTLEVTDNGPRCWTRRCT